MNKSILSMLLALILVLSSFTGCAGTPDGQSPEPTVSGFGTQPEPTVTDQPTEAITTADPTADDYVLNAETLDDYVIIYPGNKTYLADRIQAEALAAHIAQQIGKEIRMVSDNVPAPEGVREIVVGRTKRELGTQLLEGRHKGDSMIVATPDAIFVGGNTTVAVENAVSQFAALFCVGTAQEIRIVAPTYELFSNYTLSKELSINGTPLNDYTIVYPADADRLTYYMAIALFDYFQTNAELMIRVSPDSVAESANEILIGATNRQASQKAVALAPTDNEFVFFAEGNQLVMHGDGYYVGAAVHAFLDAYFPDDGENQGPINATNLPATPKKQEFTFPTATSAIMIIGDGMGYNHVEAALSAGALDHFYARDLPFITWCRTYSQSVIEGASATDSAASATALATGYKTINGYIGKDKNGFDVLNISEYAYDRGANVAVLTTDLLEGATPAGFNVHNINRSDATDILAQFSRKTASGELLYAKGKNQGVSDNLTTELRVALGLISAKNSTFFIMMEEAYTDKGSHSNSFGTSNHAVARINDAIAYAIAFVMLHPDTALLITADHETGGITRQANGSYVYTTTGHTNTAVPYYALGGADVEAFVMQTGGLDNVWNAMFLASIFGDDPLGDPNYYYYE